MRRFLNAILLATTMLLVNVNALFAQDPLSYLRTQCPRLTDMYQSELAACHAHYIFAVDVSLSMAKFESTVLPALEAFVDALPNGDRVTLIPFARTADRASEMGFDVVIDPQKKKAMKQMLGTLYPHGEVLNNKESKAPYLDTDVYLAQQAVAKSLQQNSEYSINIILFLSDLLHCPTKNIDRQFNKDEMADMENLLKSAVNPDVDTRVYTLELPPSGKMEGFVQPALRDLYQGFGLDVKSQKVPADSEGLIRDWFDKLKNEIMFNKLQAIIFAENRANPIEVKTEIDIDGNVIAHVQWTSAKLYPKMTLDTTYVANPSWNFKANPDYVHYSVVGEINEDLELGQIKNKSWGFHQLADTLHFNVMLPVEYQSEINRLLEGRPGPLANATEYKERLIWTFFLPLWLTITILILIIIYIILVIKAIGRNNKLRFKANITVYDAQGNQIDDTRRMPQQAPSATIAFGAGGTAQGRVDGAEWQVTVKKVKANPFLIFAKPYFEWRCTKGYCAAGKAQSGKLAYGETTSVRLKCGPSRSEESHGIKIQLT